MEEEAENFIKRHDKCQLYANNMHQPAELLHSITTPWLFMKWGVDMVGPLLQVPAKLWFLLISIDYFSEWVEACAFKQIREKEGVDFIWKSIIC